MRLGLFVPAAALAPATCRRFRGADGAPEKQEGPAACSTILDDPVTAKLIFRLRNARQEQV